VLRELPVQNTETADSKKHTDFWQYKVHKEASRSNTLSSAGINKYVTTEKAAVLITPG